MLSAIRLKSKFAKPVENQTNMKNLSCYLRRSHSQRSMQQNSDLALRCIASCNSSTAWQIVIVPFHPDVLSWKMCQYGVRMVVLVFMQLLKAGDDGWQVLRAAMHSCCNSFRRHAAYL